MASTGMLTGSVGAEGIRHHLWPVSPCFCAHTLDEVLERLVDPLHHSVALWIVRRGGGSLYPQEGAHLFEHLAGELRSVIHVHKTRTTETANPPFDKAICNRLRHLVRYGYGLNPFREVVLTDQKVTHLVVSAGQRSD